MVSFDGPNLIATLPAGDSTISVEQDLYSDWKEFFKTGTNSQFPQMFTPSIGGHEIDAVTGKEVSGFFLLRNDLGWRIRPAEENAEVVLTGNLYPTDSTLPMFVPTIGAFTVLVSVERDASAVGLPGAGLLQTDIDAIRLGLLKLSEFLALK